MRRRVDNFDMRESLRKITEQPARTRIVFFGHQSEIVAERQQLLEQLYRIVAPSDQSETVCQPEAACEKHPFAAGQPVETGARRIAQNKTVADQLALDRLDR